MEFERHYLFRVRFAEVDPQSVVFNSRYLEYADIVLTEYMRAAGIPTYGPDVVEFQVVQANVVYVQPLRFDDEAEGWIRVNRIGRSSVVFDLEFRRDGSDEATARVTLHYVHVDLHTGKSQEIPPAICAKLDATV